MCLPQETIFYSEQQSGPDEKGIRNVVALPKDAIASDCLKEPYPVQGNKHDKDNAHDVRHVGAKEAGRKTTRQ